MTVPLGCIEVVLGMDDEVDKIEVGDQRVEEVVFCVESDDRGPLEKVEKPEVWLLCCWEEELLLWVLCCLCEGFIGGPV